MLRIMLVAALGVGLGCGPKVPTHDGYRTSKPWKKSKKVEFDDNVAYIDGTVSYPKKRRARWYALQLPGDGELELTMEITPLRATRQNLALGFEVLNEDFNVVTRKYPDPEPGQKTPPGPAGGEGDGDGDGGEGDGDDWDDDDDEWLEDEDEAEPEGELEWEQTLWELPAGRYYVHVYTLGRADEADFSLRLKYTSGQALRVSNFPENVPYYEQLPVVPAFDDAPAVDCGDCRCRDSRCKKECGKCKRSRPRRRVDCDDCSCSNRRCKRRCSKCKKDEPPSDAVRARVIRYRASGGGTLVITNRGSANGVAVGWKGRVVNSKGKTIENGTFTVKKVTSSTSQGQVSASPDSVSSAGRAVLSAP